MSRFPPTKPADLSAEQKELYDQITPTTVKQFAKAFVIQDSNDALVGPLAPLLETPGLCKGYLHLASELSKLPNLPPAARETAILAVGSHFKASYEIYAHERVALHETSLSKEQIILIKNGEKPKDLDEGCSAAFDAALELVKKQGPLSQGKWEALVRCFGKIGALQVVHYVGLYCYTCVLLNGCDVPVPEGEKLM